MKCGGRTVLVTNSIKYCMRVKDIWFNLILSIILNLTIKTYRNCIDSMFYLLEFGKVSCIYSSPVLATEFGSTNTDVSSQAATQMSVRKQPTHRWQLASSLHTDVISKAAYTQMSVYKQPTHRCQFISSQHTDVKNASLLLLGEKTEHHKPRGTRIESVFRVK